MRFKEKVLLLFVVVGSAEWVRASPLKPGCEGKCENNVNNQAVNEMSAMIKQHQNNFYGSSNGENIIGAKIEQTVNNFNGSENGGTIARAQITQSLNNFGSDAAYEKVQEANTNWNQKAFDFTLSRAPDSSDIRNGASYKIPQAPGYSTYGYHPDEHPPNEYRCFEYAPNGHLLYGYRPYRYPSYPPTAQPLYKLYVCGTIDNSGQKSLPVNPDHTDTGATAPVPLLPAPTSGYPGSSGDKSSQQTSLKNSGSVNTQSSPPLASTKRNSNEHRVYSYTDHSLTKDDSTTSLPPTQPKDAIQKVI